MNAATKPSTSACPRSDRPASCSPAAQPSVRAASAAAAASGSGAPGRAPPGAAATCGQQRRRLPGREPQVRGAQLGQLPAGPQPRQGQRRVAAACQRQVQPRRPVLKQEPERRVHRLRADHVIVIQDQQQRLVRVRPAGYLVDQGRHQRLERRRRRRPEQRAQPLADPRPRPVQRGHRMPPEPGRVVVAGIQRQPRRRHAGRAGPSRPAGPSCRTRPARRPGPALRPGPRRAVPPAAGAAPDRAATRARSAWWPAGHRAPTLRPSAAAGSPIGNLHDRRLQRTCVAARTSHRSCQPPALNSGALIRAAPSCRRRRGKDSTRMGHLRVTPTRSCVRSVQTTDLNRRTVHMSALRLGPRTTGASASMSWLPGGVRT